MINRLSEIAPAVGIIAAATAAVIGFYAGQAVAEHNSNITSHPSISFSIKSNRSKIDLLDQRLTLNQQRNDEAHQRSEKAQVRILDALVRIDEKLDTR